MKKHINKITVVLLLIVTGWANASEQQRTLPVYEIPNSKKILETPSQQFPELKFKDETGNIISLKSLRGKVVFINLWATWCPPCIHEMPSINGLRNTFKDNDDLIFLMVDMDNKIEKSKAWMESNNYDLPVHVMDSRLPRELFSGSIPTTIIVDKQNNIVARHVGIADYNSPEIIELMEKLLNEKL
ncbi:MULTISPECIES: TlpA family protein disulfide reductase [Galbibacter]|nr:TlpA disulfide reductase family protein [Galbibacter marinus]